MIEHVIALQGRPSRLSDLDDVVTTHIDEVKSRLRGVSDATGGRNFNPDGAPYTHVVVLRFDNRESLAAYSASTAWAALSSKLPRLTFHQSIFDVNVEAASPARR
jgi:hypothetical protein